MRTVFLLMLILVAKPSLAIESDKVSHFAGSSALGLVADSVAYHTATQMGPDERIAVSAGVALVPGFIIECVDEFSGYHFSWLDLMADALGVGTGSVAGELLNGQFWISASGRQVRLIGHW
jgi:hypothetical protein